MNKKTLFGITSTCLLLTSLFGFAACRAPLDSGDGENHGDKQTYTVTFRQKGKEDVVRSVEHGATLANIPKPIQRPGYTITWEEKDLTNITQSIIVNAVEIANRYTVTYNLGVNTYATLDSYTAQVTYNEEFTLKTPQYSGSAPFLGWYLANADGKATDEKVENGKYLWAEDIKLIAKWDEWSQVVS